jgi:hypothetical protein
VQGVSRPSARRQRDTGTLFPPATAAKKLEPDGGISSAIGTASGGPERPAGTHAHALHSTARDVVGLALGEAALHI